MSADVNDIIHAPRYLVIAFLGPVSTIPCEVVTYSKDTWVLSSRKRASLLLWVPMQKSPCSRMASRIGWIRQLAGLRDLPHTISHFPLPSPTFACAAWAVLAPRKHLSSTKTAELRWVKSL